MNEPNKADMRTPRREHMLIYVLLVLVTVAVFWRVGQFDYISLDDNSFVRLNSTVQKGLTPETVEWAFTTAYQSIWQPLNWLSFMLDKQIAPGPGMNHITNLLLHIISTLLLYTVLSRMTGFRWRSAFVAFLFAVHPVHVESVVWVTERKDVLSTVFWMCTMLAYVWYSEKPSIIRYPLIIIAFALGLMSKPMLVTLPIVLLLLDYWPLKRGRRKGATGMVGCTWGRLIAQKIPLLILTLISVDLTYGVMESQNNVGTLVKVSTLASLSVAVVNYARYMGMMLWPAHLSVLYSDAYVPTPAWIVVLSTIVFTGLTVLAVRCRRDRPYVTFGWLWYVVTLLPVCGLVQTGILIRADHYTYVPLIGIFVMIAWGVPDLLETFDTRKVLHKYLVPGTLILALLITILAYRQVGYWRDSVTVFTHAYRVTKHNFDATLCLGIAYGEKLNVTKCIKYYREATELNPASATAHYYLGTTLSEQGRLEEAVPELQMAVDLQPKYFTARVNLGTALANTGRLDQAIEQFAAALQMEPDNEMVRGNLESAKAQREAAARHGNVAP